MGFEILGVKTYLITLQWLLRNLSQAARPPSLLHHFISCFSRSSQASLITVVINGCDDCERGGLLS